MARDLASKVQLFRAMVDHVMSYEEDDELYVVLTRRDEIHDALKMGETLSPESARLLEQGDEKLLAQAEALAGRFPDVFTDRAPRDYWWWHLEKGPRAREKPREAA